MNLTYCKKCHDRKMVGSFESVVKIFEKMEHISSVGEACTSYCGPGRSEYHVIVDDELISTKTLEQLIKEVEEYK